MARTTIDNKDIENFSSISSAWWDRDGPFAVLHLMNKLRLAYIQNQIAAHYGVSNSDIKSALSGLNILDIGCGGGILSIPLSRLGAKVTAIDASSENIKVAKAYAQEIGIDVCYIHTAIEKMRKNENFDVVCCLEVIEHVADHTLFLKHACRVLRPGGMLFISTINKTILSYLQAIIGAEWILRFIPVGTHDWNKFLKPSQIVEALNKHKVELQNLSGMSFNPLTQEWSMTTNVSVNYILTAAKC